MPQYRLYLLDGGHAIQARDEFGAEDDAAAVVIAQCLFDACSDIYQGYELWCGSNRLTSPLDGSRQAAPFRTLAEITQSTQEVVAERERILLDSAWAITRSQKLVSANRELQHELARKGRNGGGR